MHPEAYNYMSFVFIQGSFSDFTLLQLLHQFFRPTKKWVLFIVSKNGYWKKLKEQIILLF